MVKVLGWEFPKVLTILLEEEFGVLSIKNNLNVAFFSFTLLSGALIRTSESRPGTQRLFS